MSATDLITVYVKNLAGDLFPLEVEPTLPLHEIAHELTLSDPEAYPIGRVQLLRLPQSDEDEEGDEKEFQPPLSPEEVLAVVIMDSARLEQGIWPQGGQTYTRLVIPFRGQPLYLYLTYHGNGFRERTWMFGTSLSPAVTKPSETIRGQHHFLYQTMKTAVPDVTPAEMSALYEVVIPYCNELEKGDEYAYLHLFDPKEPVECGCGSVVKRSGLTAHTKTKKHMLFVQQQQE